MGELNTKVDKDRSEQRLCSLRTGEKTKKFTKKQAKQKNNFKTKSRKKLLRVNRAKIKERKTIFEKNDKNFRHSKKMREFWNACTEYNTPQYDTIRCKMIKYNTIQCNTVQ